MTRRNFRQAAVLSAIVLTTPLLALLCRGHAPSRFAAPNLPFWQRALPHPACLAVSLRCPPAAPGTVRYDAFRPQNVNEDQLLAGLERPSARSAQNAGQAGQWLESACALGRDDARLRRAEDDVATRLMNAQDPDGYLAMGTSRTRWSPAQADAFSHNLRGLLAFYAVSHDPSAIYAAMQAGDLTASEVSSPPAASRLLLPMTRLYLATGEPRYRAWVLRTAPRAATDGPGLCAAYGLSGERGYLRAAERVWARQAAHGRPDAELSAALWAVTGTATYLPTADTAVAPWVCPLAEGTLTYSRTPAGLAVNGWANSSAVFGAVRLTQRVVTQAGRQTATVTVRTPRPTAFTLRLFVPPGAKAGAARVTINGTTQKASVATGAFWGVRRVWKPGDTVTLAWLPAPAAPRR